MDHFLFTYTSFPISIARGPLTYALLFYFNFDILFCFIL